MSLAIIRTTCLLDALGVQDGEREPTSRDGLAAVLAADWLLPFVISSHGTTSQFRHSRVPSSRHRYSQR